MGHRFNVGDRVRATDAPTLSDDCHLEVGTIDSAEWLSGDGVEVYRVRFDREIRPGVPTLSVSERHLTPWVDVDLSTLEKVEHYLNS